MRSYRYLTISADGESTTVRFEPSKDISLGSPSRAAELCKRVVSRFRRWAPASKGMEGKAAFATFSAPMRDRALQGAADVDRFIAGIADERLTPKVVEEALGITSRERARWTKDGKLPRSGTGRFRKGAQTLQFSYYRAADIRKLAATPAVIEQWRASGGGPDPPLDLGVDS